MDNLYSMILASVIRHGLTTATGMLIADGLMEPSDQAQFIKIGTGILIGFAGVAWSWWQKYGHAKIADALAEAQNG